VFLQPFSTALVWQLTLRCAMLETGL